MPENLVPTVSKSHKPSSSDLEFRKHAKSIDHLKMLSNDIIYLLKDSAGLFRLSRASRFIQTYDQDNFAFKSSVAASFFKSQE